MAELWYRLNQIPDLTLNKYASLEGRGVEGVIERHVAFLRQLNRQGMVSGLSYHLFYLYLSPENKMLDMPGHRIHVFLMIQGNADSLNKVPALIQASPLSDFYGFEPREVNDVNDSIEFSLDNVLIEMGMETPVFNTCAILSKSETLLPAGIGEGEEYYLIRDWEMNEGGRLYNMCKMMEALNHTALYRVDLYPVERGVSLRESLRKPMGILRQRQDERKEYSKKDYEGKDVLESYEELIDKCDSTPHFIANILVFASEKHDAISILDAAGSESLKKGKYSIVSFSSNFTPVCFLNDDFNSLDNLQEKMVLRRGRPGLTINREDTSQLSLNYLPTLFSLEEVAPFFRLPALYDGEVIQIAKETAPKSTSKEGSLFLGKDSNGYDVYFPLSLLPKHAFISGVPGSGKTNTMHHITSSLWKDYRIPFLVLEPAKQEYRALANDPGMKEMYLFSPNADMSFPLHINPFEMPKGTLVAEHIRRLCSVFEGAFPLDPPMPYLLDTAIEAVYRENGWIPEQVYTGDEKQEDSDDKRVLPTMSMLYRRLEKELESTKYSDEVRGNLESALKVRIGSLLRREMGEVFDVPKSTFAPEKWLEVPAVIELESMGTGPANFLTLMLCSLIRETLKVNPIFDGDIRHVIVIEEAHNLIGPEAEEQSGSEANPKQAATAFVVKMLAEVRALKEGIIIADQLPTVMAQEVLKNTGLKIGLRITSEDDRLLLGGTMAANSLQLEQMATFAVGEALIFYEGLMRPFIMRVKEWWGEIDDKAKKEEMVAPKNDTSLKCLLSDYSTYLDENIRSIKIMGSKFYYLFDSIENRVAQYEKWLKAVSNEAEKIMQIESYLEQVEFGKIIITDEEKQRKYDQLEALIVSRESVLLNKSKIYYGVDFINLISDWVYSLERLKYGRWRSFSAPENEIIKITLLQGEMCERILQLYELMIQAFGATDGEPLFERKIDRIVSLSKHYSEELGNYIKENGPDCIQ